jgi:hypothetical protein
MKKESSNKKMSSSLIKGMIIGIIFKKIARDYYYFVSQLLGDDLRLVKDHLIIKVSSLFFLFKKFKK